MLIEGSREGALFACCRTGRSMQREPFATSLIEWLPRNAAEMTFFGGQPDLK